MIRPFLLASLLLSFAPQAAFAHGGGLNAEGCHNDRRNGGYHCHRAPARSARPVSLVRPVSRLYANCMEARLAGAAPFRRGEPGYGTHLDRDGDGIGCDRGGTTMTALARAKPISTASARHPQTLVSSTLPLPIEGAARVLDGDTIQVGLTRVRLFGIDAFEGEQLCQTSEDNTYGCGGRATRELTEQIDNEPVSCMPRGTDAYGRTTAVCRVNSVDLSSHMARSGHALAYTKYALDYVSDEAAAKQSKAGAWGGTFELPWEYRQTRPGGAAEAQRQSVAPSLSCTIKGNVNKQGERIYHLSADPFYARTKPENWFCSTKEAETAGFRRAGTTTE